MSKVSKFLKLHKDVLLEYIYDDGNLISEPYNILVNSKEKTNSYIAYDTTVTNNNLDNQLYLIDAIDNKWGESSTSKSFLQVKNYGDNSPLQHDKLKFHIPINWTFGEYLGFHVRVYAFDKYNTEEYNLTNFYYDMTDPNTMDLLEFSSPALLFQEKMWGKYIQVQIPSLNALSSQLDNNRPTIDSINYNLTDGNSLSVLSPIFIEFNFITKKKVINGEKQYTLESSIVGTVPQTPEFEKLGLKIEHSKNGDFYEIYGTYNGTIGEFNRFVEDSISLGNRYYVQYNITMYEQNVRGKTTTITVTDHFNEYIEYRPIIKYSTTTAIIDVEMRLIDAVDESYIIRKSSYGMLQDEVSKYSLKLMKINLDKAYKPKIYNIKSSINPDLVGMANSFGIIPINNNPKSPKNPRIDLVSTEVKIEKVKVPYPILIDKYNIISSSDSSILGGETFEGFNRMEIIIYPFDNFFRFTIATGSNVDPKLMDLTLFNEIKFVIKDDDNRVESELIDDPSQIDLTNGMVAFKVEESKFKQIKRIFMNGTNSFYITGSNPGSNSLIYTGKFKLDDGKKDSNVILEDVEIPTPIEKPELIVTPRYVNEVTLSKAPNLNLDKLSSISKNSNLLNAIKKLK